MACATFLPVASSFSFPKRVGTHYVALHLLPRTTTPSFSPSSLSKERQIIARRFVWLVLEIETQFEAMIRKTARNVHASSWPSPDEAVSTMGAPLRRPVSMSALRYPQLTMRTPKFLSLSPQPTTWNQGPVNSISNHGLPSPGMESPQNYQVAKLPRAHFTQAQAARSSIALQHWYLHQRLSDISNTSLRFSTSLAQAQSPAHTDGVAPFASQRQSRPGSGNWTTAVPNGAPTALQQRSLRHHSSTSALPPSTSLRRHSTSVSLETLAEDSPGAGVREVEIARTLGSLVGEQASARSPRANASAGPSPRSRSMTRRPPIPEKSSRRSLAASPTLLEYYGVDELTRPRRHDSGDDEDGGTGVKIQDVEDDGKAEGNNEQNDQLFQ